MKSTLRSALAALALALPVAGCLTDAGSDPRAVREVVERAAAAREAGDFEAFAACFVPDVAGSYRLDLKTGHQSDEAAFFADKRGMVVTGPVNMRRQAFATVGVFVLDATGAKPRLQAGVVYRDGEWLLDGFVPGDHERPRTAEADLEGIVALLRREAVDPRPGPGDGSFRRIQLQRALEVVAERRPPAAVAPLMDLLNHDAAGGIRQFAAAILGELKAVEAAQALRAALADSDLRVRGDAAWALGRIGDRQDVAALRQRALEDDSPWVRRRAGEALAAMGEPLPPAAAPPATP